MLKSEAHPEPVQLKIYFGEKMEGEDFRSMLEKAGKSEAVPGEILSDGKSFFAVTTADGAVSLTDVQLSGKKRMDVKAFLAGFRNPESWKIVKDTK